MSNYIVIRNKVNIGEKKYSFLHEFPKNMSITDGVSSSQGITTGKSPIIPTSKKYMKLDTSITKRQQVRQLVKTMLTEEYKQKYLFIPSTLQRYKVSTFVIMDVNGFTKNRVLYTSETTNTKLLTKQLGTTFFENLTPKQKVFIVDVKFFVKHKERTLQDSFDEFCVNNREKFRNSLYTFTSKTKAFRNTKKRKTTSKYKGGTRRCETLKIYH